MKVNKVDKPISKSYIEEEKEDEKKGKIINSLVRNAKSTPDEAKQAVAVVNNTTDKSRVKKVTQDYSSLAGINRRTKK